MRKLLVICTFAVLLAGCAEERKFLKSPFGGPDVLICQAAGYAAFGSQPYQSGRRQQIDTAPFPGFLVVENEGKVVIDTIIGGENIFKELRREDQIVSVNNRAVTGKKQFLELVRGGRFNEVSFLTFRRFSGEFTLAIKLSQMNMPRMYTNFEKKLLDNKKVSIAIFPSANTSITNATINREAVIEQDRNFICAAFEKTFITEFASYTNFSIIDRNVIDKIINEQKFQLSGAVDESTIQQIGKITGASHLFFTTMSRNEGSFGFSERLIEVETAKVIYSDSYVYTIPKPKVVVVKKKTDKDNKDEKDTKKEEKKIETPIVINNYITNTNTNTNTNVVSNTNINNNTGNNSNTTTINNK